MSGEGTSGVLCSRLQRCPSLLSEMFPPRIRYSSMSIPYHIGTGYFGGFLPSKPGQRVKALEAFLADVYGPNRAVADGVVPRGVITSS